MNARNRNRLVLAALVGLFALPLSIAWLLSASHWHPRHTRSSGALVNPPRDLRGVAVTLDDGTRLAWQDPQYRWTLLALPGAACEVRCRQRLEEVLRMRITLGRNASRLRVVYLGPPLPASDAAAHARLLAGRAVAGSFASERAHEHDDLALAVVDPRGLLMLHYAPGYSAQGLRSDIKKVIY